MEAVPEKQPEIATLAGGCFWGIEKLFNKEFGDKLRWTQVGYIGGTASDANYKSVCSAKTGHAEAVQLAFDPASVGYSELLKYFWKIHDPTTLNRQGNDIGPQYRSAVFCHTEDQFTAAQEVKLKMQSNWKNDIVTEIVRAAISDFHRAEEYHQKYLEKNPGGYCNHREYHK